MGNAQQVLSLNLNEDRHRALRLPRSWVHRYRANSICEFQREFSWHPRHKNNRSGAQAEDFGEIEMPFVQGSSDDGSDGVLVDEVADIVERRNAS